VRLRANRRYLHNRAAYLLLLPWFVGFFGLTLGPMAASFLLSLTEFDLLSLPRWVGLDNYVAMFTADPRYQQSLRVTALYVLLSVPLRLAFALAVAVALHRGLKALGIFRAAFYLPSLLGGSVAIAVLWQQIFSADGLVNTVLGGFGLQDLPSWIANPDYSLFTLVALAVWEFGAPMVIFLAGLNQIPREFHEAAAVDGAGRVGTFVRITLPLLSPVIFFNLVMQTIGSFKTFTPAFVISNGTGGPSDSTLFYTLYLYQQGFTYFHMGYAAAMAWILLAVIAAFTAVNFFGARYWVHYTDEAR
jgi:multiple sugar transport system permease protein